MLKKLSSVFKNPALRLAPKALVFTGLLAWQLKIKPAGFIPAFLFLSVCFYFYWRPIFAGRQFLGSFLTLLIISFLTLRFSGFGLPGIIACLGLGILFYWLLGTKNLIFGNRPAIYFLLNSYLIFSVFLFFFLADKSQMFSLKYLLAGLGIFLLSNEFLVFFAPDFPKRRILVVAGFSFLIMELLWAVSLLPIGFLNSASLMLLTVFVAMDFILHHFNGTLSRRLILRNTTAWIVLSIVIFAASKWGL